MARLCPACGFCCNGVLFGNVELQPLDDAKKLESLGLRLERKRRQTQFLQPCACYKEGLCGIYSVRPQSCRAFECRLVQRVNQQKISVPIALAAIEGARKQVQEVRDLVSRLGDNNEQLPLNQRCANIIAQPIDLAGDPATGRLRTQLMRAVHKLAQLLERDFVGS